MLNTFKTGTVLSLLLLLSLLPQISPVYATEGSYKDWYWDLSHSEELIAETKNEDGHYMGYVCLKSKRTCYYYLEMNTTCDEGDEYNTLVNSKSGVYYLTLICTSSKNDEGKMVYFDIIKEYKHIDEIIEESSSISFAHAMESGEFSISTFSLKGAKKVMNKVMGSL